MVRHGGSSAGSYLADPTSPIPSHCASIFATSTVRVKYCADLVHSATVFVQKDEFVFFLNLNIQVDSTSGIHMMH